MSDCLRSLIPGASRVEVYHAARQGTAHYGQLQVCGSVWACPVCAAKITERRREELQRAIELHRATGGIVLIAAFTFSHGPRMALADSVERFQAAFRSMTSHRAYKRVAARYGLVGTVKALEVTWGEANGWHPHAHVLLFLDGSAAVDVGELQQELYRAWSVAARARGLTMTPRRGLVVQSTWGAVVAYLEKWGHLPERRLWDATDELTRAHSKRARADEDGQRYTPFDLLRWVAATGEARAGLLFREFVEVFSGGRRRQLVWSPGLRDRLGLADEATDEELATRQEDDAVLLGRLELADWQLVRYHEMRGQLLVVAGSGDWSQVVAFLDELREHAPPAISSLSPARRA